MVLMVYAALPGRTPPMSQAFYYTVNVLFAIIVHLLVDRNPTLPMLHIVPMLGSFSAIAGIILSWYDEIVILSASTTSFFDTSLFWDIFFIVGHLMLAFGNSFESKFMKRHSRQATKASDIYNSLLSLMILTTFFQLLTYLALVWVDIVPRLGYSGQSEFESILENFQNSATCFFSAPEGCENTWIFGLVMFSSIVLSNLSSYGLLMESNEFYRIIPGLLISPFAVIFWVVDDFVFGLSGVVTENIWIALGSFFLLIIGQIMLVYWRYNFFKELSEKQEPKTEENIKDSKIPRVCPIEDASFFSQLFYFWFSDIMKLGYERPLKEEDLWTLHPVDRCELTADRFEKYWNIEKLSEKPSLAKAFVKTFWKDFILSFVAQSIYIITIASGPAIVMRNLLDFIEHPTSGRPEYGWILAGSLWLTSCLAVLFHQYSWNRTTQIGTRVKGCFIELVYRKCTRLGGLESSVGEVLNMASNDSMRVYWACRYFNQGWSGLVLLVSVAALLINEIGWPAVMGTIVFLLAIPLQALLARIVSRVRSSAILVTDSRVRLMNDILSAIKLVKLYCWEQSFQQKVKNVRREEKSWLQKSAHLKYLNFSTSLFVCEVAVFVTISTYAGIGNTLSTSLVFSTLTLFNVIKLPVIVLPDVYRYMAETMVSFDRLEKFLLQPEVEDKRDYDPVGSPNSPKFLQITNGVFNINKIEFSKKKKKKDKYKEEDEDEDMIIDEIHDPEDDSQLVKLDINKPTLNNINLSVKSGELVAVVGRVGSGKTTLLRSILGDVPLISGSVKVSGSIAYASQSAWLVNDSLRNNITFGSELDNNRYANCVSVCQLETDLTLLPSGDQTEIGERGVNLSGGQKQRISLARATYTNKDIYLLDDPLSAVDQHVAKKIFTECIQGLLSKKAVLFVTNQLQFLPNCDKILFLQNGEVSGYDTFRSLLATNSDFADLVSEFADTGDDNDDDADEDNDEIVSISKEAKKMKTSKKSAKPAKEEVKKTDSDQGKLIEKEERITGGIDTKVYMAYFKGGGIVLSSIVLILCIMVGIGRTMLEWFLSYWLVNSQVSDEPVEYYIAIFGGLAVMYIVITLIRGAVFAIFAMSSASQIHNSVFKKIMRVPMKFFDSTPLGRILNRFSQDQDKVDASLPDIMLNWLHYTVHTLCVIGVIISAFPWFGIALVPIVFIFWLLVNYYVTSSRELKRIESISVSPVFSHLSATLSGLTTIRAYGALDRFKEENTKRVNFCHAALFAYEQSGRWIGIRMDLLVSSVLGIVSFLAILLRDEISPATAGLCVSFSYQMIGAFQWAVRTYADTQNLLTSYERLLYYRENLETEAPTKTNIVPLPQWPAHGSIRFKNVEVKYRPELPPVLRNVNFTIRPQEKIGIVGRTGAGKSTLTTVLFRLVELTSGQIFIDDVDISTIGLDDLRQKLAIIPQDPVLFLGSLRFNLDPFSEYSDEQVWESLRKVHLAPLVRGFPEQLETQVLEGGENLSLGQRQLLCIARALLRNSKILILDEATAAIDIETDNLIQKTIRSSFSHCTVLTIAHRLHTIIDSDRIMVMDKGMLAEFDTPQTLLSDPLSLFSGLVDQTDPQTSKKLRDAANNSKSW
eukprot:TRINITY_DN3212_c0_g1_i3.p1 TRINITY_DN3212_c0_g1~~TRINITY_DN3212_c0_g1_i3.p1  ORF type:complete len:1599 (+),score=296.82 TRINITY_DN3212_c0_g1_i3:668-5464(+)